MEFSVIPRSGIDAWRGRSTRSTSSSWAIAGFFTALICILIRDLRRALPAEQAVVDRSNPPTASKLMEVLWIGVPLFLGMVMFVWGANLFFRIYDPPGDALEVAVVAKQWMWYLQHAEGRSEINELHVPLGRPVKLTMTSQDVIHSFYVPAFRVKQDVLPGRYTSLWFEPTQVGRYHLLLCRVLRDESFDDGGLGHGRWSRSTFSAG